MTTQQKINTYTILKLIESPKQFISWLGKFNLNQQVGWSTSWTNCPIHNFIVDTLGLQKSKIKVCQKKIYCHINDDDLNPDNIEIDHNVEWVIKFIYEIDNLGETPITKEKSLNIIEKISCVKGGGTIATMELFSK